MTEQFKVMAITHLKQADIQTKLGVSFVSGEDILGPLYLAKSPERDGLKYQIRIRGSSPEPSTEIMLKVDTALRDLDSLLEKIGITREQLFWIHPRAGGTLRRNVVDRLIANLEESKPLVQILVGPRQVGKTTAVKHLMKEWGAATLYATADSVVGDYHPWLEEQWRKALLLGEGTLLVLDEIQKIEDWAEHIKFLWDTTQNRGIRVVLLGSTSLSHCLSSKKMKESFAGRFYPIYVPHWSYSETNEAFGSSLEEYSLYGGYPKAMEFSSDLEKWFGYIGGSIINPIIDIDIFQQGSFKKIDSLRRAFRVFCGQLDERVNYLSLLKEIQQSGNVEIVKRYLEGYFDSFLISPVPYIDDEGNSDSRKKPMIMTNCPAVYTFGRETQNNVSNDHTRLRQSVAGEIKRIPQQSFGYWQKTESIKMDFVVKTLDGQMFGIDVEDGGSRSSKEQSYSTFRKTFKGARIASVDPDNYGNFLKGHRAFLEVAAV